MKLSVFGLALATGIIWSASVLIAGVLHALSPDYGVEFLAVVSSIYPGYHNLSTPLRIVISTAYALVDGLIGGAVFALLYNCFSCCCRKATTGPPAGPTS